MKSGGLCSWNRNTGADWKEYPWWLSNGWSRGRPELRGNADGRSTERIGSADDDQDGAADVPRETGRCPGDVGWCTMSTSPETGLYGNKHGSRRRIINDIIARQVHGIHQGKGLVRQKMAEEKAKAAAKAAQGGK